VFWVTSGDTKLYVFRSKADFEEWATNPYLTAERRAGIPKLAVNFKKNEYNLGVKCFRASALHNKNYGKKEGTLCMFKLEKWLHHGPIVLGAFASKSKPEVGSFQVICNAMIDRQNFGLQHLIATKTQVGDNILKSLSTRD